MNTPKHPAKKSKRELAYDRAGTAVVCRAFGRKIRKVSLARGDSDPDRAFSCDGGSDFRATIVISISGAAARRRFDPACGDGMDGHYEEVRNILHAPNILEGCQVCPRANLPVPAGVDFYFDDLGSLDFDECNQAAEKLVQENWPAIEKLAKALLKRWSLTGEEIEAVLS